MSDGNSIPVVTATRIEAIAAEAVREADDLYHGNPCTATVRLLCMTRQWAAEVGLCLERMKGGGK